MRKISDKSNYYAIDYVTRYFIGQCFVLLCYKLCHILMRILNYIKFVTKIIYVCRPGVWVTTPFSYLLKYMVICVFENPPQFQASWQHRLFTLDMGSLKKKNPFPFTFL